MAITRGKVLAVSVGLPREFESNGRPARSAIWKSPVAGRVAARGVNLVGDDQADRRAHGGPDKAVYAYAVEDLDWWAEQIGRTLQYGELGENLTTKGIDVNGAPVGERWAIGTTVLEVSEPRVPCWKLGVRMNDKLFPRRFTEALRPGALLRILVEGDVGAGDEIRVIERPATILPSAMFSASTPSIGKRPGASWRSPGCPRTGDGGRNTTCKKPRAALRRQSPPDALIQREGKERFDGFNPVLVEIGQGRIEHFWGNSMGASRRAAVPVA